MQLAHCHAKTLILTARSETSLQQIAQECHNVSSNTTIHIVTCDLSNADSVTQLGKDALACCCHVDILILNAGVSSRSTFFETSPEVDAEVMQVNFLSGVLLAKTLVPGMIQQQTGALVWISGFHGLRKYIYTYIYHAMHCPFSKEISSIVQLKLDCLKERVMLHPSLQSRAIAKAYVQSLPQVVYRFPWHIQATFEPI